MPISYYRITINKVGKSLKSAIYAGMRGVNSRNGQFKVDYIGKTEGLYHFIGKYIGNYQIFID